jgi:hypothetical protein
MLAPDTVEFAAAAAEDETRALSVDALHVHHSTTLPTNDDPLSEMPNTEALLAAIDLDAIQNRPEHSASLFSPISSSISVVEESSSSIPVVDEMVDHCAKLGFGDLDSPISPLNLQAQPVYQDVSNGILPTSVLDGIIETCKKSSRFLPLL